MEIQLDLFYPATPMTMLNDIVKRQSKEIGNLRRGLFQRHGKLAKELLDCKQETEELRLEIKRLKEIYQEPIKMTKVA